MSSGPGVFVMPFPGAYFPDLITYWAPSSVGRYDVTNVLPPVLVDGRWEDESELFRDAQKRETVSNAIVYLPLQVEPKGWLALGDELGRGTRATYRFAMEIRQVARHRSLGNEVELYQAWL